MHYTPIIYSNVNVLCCGKNEFIVYDVSFGRIKIYYCTSSLFHYYHLKKSHGHRQKKQNLFPFSVGLSTVTTLRYVEAGRVWLVPVGLVVRVSTLGLLT